MLVELYVPGPNGWAEYVLTACWVKHTISDLTLLNNRTPFELMFGRKPGIVARVV